MQKLKQLVKNAQQIATQSALKSVETPAARAIVADAADCGSTAQFWWYGCYDTERRNSEHI